VGFAAGGAADATARLGMNPSAWRNGGKGTTIFFAVAPSSLGPLLVAATRKGLCRIAFDESEADLRARFPKATILPGAADFSALVADVVALVDDPGRSADLPVDVAGTAFQQAVWSALRAIPAGETRTYAQIAAAVGKPGAVRAPLALFAQARASGLYPVAIGGIDAGNAGQVAAAGAAAVAVITAVFGEGREGGCAGLAEIESRARKIVEAFEAAQQSASIPPSSAVR